MATALRQFDYRGAREAGYSDDEIMPFLSEQHPNFDVKSAQDSGYTPQEINEFLSTYKPERSVPEQGGRIAAQFGLGVLQGTPGGLAYEAAVAPLASKEAQTAEYRKNLFEDIETFQQAKQLGGFPGRAEPWNPNDEEQLQNLIEQAKDVSKSEPFIQTADLGIRDLAEKATGLDLHPEGFLEKAASWAGFVKDPKKLAQLQTGGVTLPRLMKAIMPTGAETMRGIGAGIGLEMAEQGNFGPIGTMAAAVAGDLMGGGAAKGVTKIVKEPKKTLAQVIKAFTPKEKLKVQKEIIKDFRDSGIQADLGTITDSNLIKWTQSRLVQSGFTGKALDEFKDTLTSQIKDEYKTLAEGLGEARFANNHEAGEVTKSWLRDIRDTELRETRELYKQAEESLKDKAYVDSNRLATAIEKLERSLTPGSIKSTEQRSVLNALDNLKKDIYDSSGKLMFANVKELMNNKIALNDVINYEVQGGAKQLLKGIVSELDRAIISYGKENPAFGKNYILANKRFSEHAKTFRNKNIDQLLRMHDPAQVMNKMNSIQGIRDLEKVLTKSPGGREAFDSLKRLKLDQIVNDNLIDSTTQQVKLGTFSKLGEKGKNVQILKELLGPKAFARLQKLQKNAGRLEDAAQKFYNTSKSGTTAVDVTVLTKGLRDLANVLMGNPWPLVRTVSTAMGVRRLTNLLADPQFLKLVEDVILASEKGTQQELIFTVEQLRPYILTAMNQMREE